MIDSRRACGRVTAASVTTSAAFADLGPGQRPRPTADDTSALLAERRLTADRRKGAAICGGCWIKKHQRASALPRFRASALPCFRASALPRFRASALPRFRASALPRFRASALPRFRASALPCFRASALPRFRASALPRRSLCARSLECVRFIADFPRRGANFFSAERPSFRWWRGGPMRLLDKRRAP
jgi:hypothetical protein